MPHVRRVRRIRVVALLGTLALLAALLPARGSAAPGQDPAAASGPHNRAAVGPAVAPHAGVIFPPGCDAFKPPPPLPGETTQADLCGYLAGFSNVTKLNSAALVGEPENGFISTAAVCCTGLVLVNGVPHIYTINLGLVTVPPAQTTVLTFGFVPVTATIELRQVGAFPVSCDITLRSPFVQTCNTSCYVSLLAPRLQKGCTDLGILGQTAKMSLHISNVTVNGTPLDVGPACETSAPINLDLSGTGNPITLAGYTISGGGPLSGSITVPPFHGCGVGEDLDSLFTATIAGPNNLVKFTQGALCTDNPPSNTTGCPPPTIPPVPGPQR